MGLDRHTGTADSVVTKARTGWNWTMRVEERSAGKKKKQKKTEEMLKKVCKVSEELPSRV